MTQQLHWTAILVKGRRGESREGSTILRRAMIESGIPYQCEACGCPPEWKGLPLTLEIDHISGDVADNERGNVRFLCPNCHTQTRNYGARARGKLDESAVDAILMYGD